VSTRWRDEGDWTGERLAWWQALGIVLLVTGIGPIVLVQLCWFLVTGDRLGG
jgi:hypothetical protein